MLSLVYYICLEPAALSIAIVKGRDRVAPLCRIDVYALDIVAGLIPAGRSDCSAWARGNGTGGIKNTRSLYTSTLVCALIMRLWH